VVAGPLAVVYGYVIWRLGLRIAVERVWWRLHEAVTRTRELADRIATRDFDTAQKMRGTAFIEMAQLFESLSRALPSADAARLRQDPGSSPRRIAVLNVGGLAPGMNAAARAAARLGLQRGHTVLGVNGSFGGLIDGDVRELAWGDVSGWIIEGGTERGISRHGRRSKTSTPSGAVWSGTASTACSSSAAGTPSRRPARCAPSATATRRSRSRRSCCRPPSTTTSPPPR
jgi:hypothetical protein